MNVELASADLHVRMVERFGLPTPSQTKHEEAIGWYHFDDETRYWFFNPRTATWRIASGPGARHNENRLIGTTWSDEDRAFATKALSHLELVAPPPAPVNIDEPCQSEPFVYEGWLFQWFYYPTLARWELAPLHKA